MNLRVLVFAVLMSSAPFAQEPTKGKADATRQYVVWVYKWANNGWQKQSEYTFADNRKAHEYVEQVKAFSENWTATTNAPLTPEREAASDAKKMVGVWFPVFTDEKTKKEVVIEEMFFEITEYKFNAYNLTRLTRSGMPYKLDTTKSPRWIELERLKGDKQKGIYEFLDKDRLRICGGVWGKERPREFKDTEATVLMELKRVYNNLEELQAARDKAREGRLKSLIEQYSEMTKAKEKGE